MNMNVCCHLVGLLLVLTTIPGKAAAQECWTQVHPLHGGSTRRVFMVDSLNGMIVGASGTILRTLDGGWTWERLASGTDADLWDVSMVDELTAYVVGSSNTILRTSNGGAHWDNLAGNLPSGTMEHFQDVSCHGRNVAMLFGALATILRTTDGGGSWQDVSSDSIFGSTAGCLIDSLRVVLVQENGLVFRSSNGGQDWIESPNHVSPWRPRRVAMVNSDTGWVVGSYGLIARTTDGGSSWLQQGPLGSRTFFVDLSFSSTMVGTVIGYGGPFDTSIVMRTTDGGESWISQDTGPRHAVGGISFVDENLGILVGSGGAILHTSDGGNSWTHISSGVIGMLHDVEFPEADVGVAVGDFGVVMRTTNGGRTWVRPLCPPEIAMTYLTAVEFSGSRHGIAVGNFGTIVRTVDGGLSWRSLESGTNEHLTSIIMFDSNVVTVVGLGGTILNTTDGGETWRHAEHPQLGSSSAWFGVTRAEGLTGLIFGTGGEVLNTTDGGATWLSATDITGRPCGAVAAVDSSTLVALWRDTVWRTDDRGHSWLAVYEDSGAHFGGVGFVDSQCGYLFGEHTVYRSSDAGKSWRKDPWRTSAVVSGGYFRTLDTGWLVGSPSAIFRTTGCASTSIRICEEDAPSASFRLIQNFPNPFNPSTTIRYILPSRSHVTLSVFTILGQRVATLEDGVREAGTHEIAFDRGALSSGVYLYRLTVGTTSFVKKLVILR